MLGYSEDETRALLSQAVRTRWPGERLLLLTPCRARRGPAGAAWFLEPGPDGVVGSAGSGEDEEGFLAATPARLIFHRRMPAALVVRRTGTALGIVAVLSLVLGGGLVQPLAIAGVAAFLRVASRVMETLSAGSVDIEYGRIAWVDRGLQHLAGVTRGGVPYRFEIRDFSDFRVTLSVLGGSGRADAA